MKSLYDKVRVSLRVALLTTDNRENAREYQKCDPIFGTAVQALLDGMQRVPELEVHVISNVQRPVRSPEKIAQNIWYHSLLVPKIGWLRGGYLGCIQAVRRKLREIQPDIVHGQGTERDCAMSAVFSGHLNVLTIHGNIAELARVMRPPLGTYWWWAARLETFALKRTHGVFCNSQFTESLVKPRASRTWRVANTLREIFFAPFPESHPVGAIPVLLVAGTINANKRQLELLQVFRRLHEKGFRFAARFLGQADPNDPYAANFLAQIKLAQEQGFASHQKNFITGQELVNCFDQASALVHFPISEAFGLVVAEALARNLKLFAAKSGGIVDVAAGVEGVELINPDDPQELENAVAKWLGEGNAKPRNADKMIRQKYHPDVIAKRHLDIYREVLGASHAISK